MKRSAFDALAIKFYQRYSIESPVSCKQCFFKVKLSMKTCCMRFVYNLATREFFVNLNENNKPCNETVFLKRLLEVM